MVALNFTQVVHHVIFQEQVDVVCGNLAHPGSVQSFESSPRFEAILLCELLSLLLDDIFVFRDRFQQQVNFEPS